jgi:hypothetical protein
MSAVAPEILNVDVGRVWLRREAIVADIDTSVRYSQSVDVERIEAIGVFR